MVTWHQENPPLSGAAYEWAGTPHASESIKYVDGVEVARNRIINGDFENGITGWQIPSSVESAAATTAFNDRMWGGLGGRLFQGYGASGQYPNIYQDISAVPAGKWLGLSALLATENRNSVSLRVQLSWVGPPPTRYNNTQWEGAAHYSGWEPHVAYQAPVDADYVRFRIQMDRSIEEQRARLWADKVIAVVADTEEDALAHSASYWDGDTPDDRAGDVWFRTSDRAAFYWDSAGRGWVPHTWDRVFHPLNGVEYAWAGEPHASESIKYVGGVEVARNRIINGDFENGVSGWEQRDLASAGTSTGYNTRMWGGLGGHHFEGRADTDPRYASIIQQTGPVPAGKYVGFSAFVATEQGDSSSLRIQLTWDGETVKWDQTPWSTASFYSGMWFHDAIPAPHDTDDLRFQIQMDKTAGSGRQRLWADRVIAVIADTREEALAHSEEYWDGNTPSTPPRSGVVEAGVSTVDRRGLVGETFARSREKINLQLAEPDERLKGGERIELAAFAASSSEVTWRWRQVTGPEVFLVREGNTCHFQAPDVDDLTDVRIAVSASSVDGANRSDWHYFDLEVRPAAGRFAAEGSDGFLPYTPQMVGYNRGKREIWNDVIAPVGMDPGGRKEPKLVDLGIPADDVTFSLDGDEPARASAGAVYVDIQDGAIYRNFGGGYNETDDTTGAPRLNAYMVSPATGEVFEWIEGADNGR